MTKKNLHQSIRLPESYRRLLFAYWMPLHKVFLLWKQQLEAWLYRYWFRLVFLGLAIFIAVQKDISIELSLQNSVQDYSERQPTPDKKQRFTNWFWTGIFDDEKTHTKEQGATKIKTERQKRQLEYVKRFAKTAQAEMEKFGIPASIKLAQGLLETDAGRSPLASKNNNHFGIKCFSKRCKKKHCSNFSDDSHKDFFRIYSTAWESYREHSKMLTSSQRYQHLLSLPFSDYKAWAVGLQQAGYATDKRYAEKLIGLIEELDLQQLDKK